VSAARSLLWPAIAALIGFAILVALGTWQMQRLAWKEGVIAAVADRTHAAPREIASTADLAAMSAAADEYRPVRLHGTFRHGDEIQVYTLLSEPRGRASGPGYWVLTPLDLAAGGGTVIVNRGFVPSARIDPSTRPEGQVAGEVFVTGLVRAPDLGNLFTPADDAATGAWFTRDPDKIAAAKGLTNVAPLIVDADAAPVPGGLPQGGETRLTFPNRHLEYALTWYGLAATLLAMFGAFAWTRMRGSSRA
jgi:surfeit locus 1 family protein